MVIDKGITNIQNLGGKEKEYDYWFGNSWVALWIEVIAPGKQHDGKKSAKSSIKPASCQSDDHPVYLH